MRHNLVSGAVFAALSAVVLWGCGGSTSTGSTSASPTTPTAAPAPSPTPTTVTVSIVSATGNTAYRPNPVTAGTGDSVMFRNNDTTLHHIVLDDGSADLGDVAPGATSRALTLRNGNALRFHCTIHSSMVGSINEAVAPPTPPCDPGYGC